MEPMEQMIVNDREGFYGWFGLGGSILQVHDSVYKLYVVVTNPFPQEITQY